MIDLLALLKRIEWAGEMMGGSHCPLCMEFDQHTDTCEIKRAIDMLENVGKQAAEFIMEPVPGKTITLRYVDEDKL